MTKASWCRWMLALVPVLLLIATGASAQTAQPIKIGGIWDLTGPSSAGNGQVGRRAIELRVEQVNKAGGTS